MRFIFGLWFGLFFVFAIFYALDHYNILPQHSEIQKQDPPADIPIAPPTVDPVTSPVIENYQADGLPPNLRIIIAETYENRLHQEAIDRFPKGVEIAIWPDSVMLESGYTTYLMNPPTDIIAAYRLGDIVNDTRGLYQASLPLAKGIFVSDISEFSKNAEFLTLIIERMANLEKTLVLGDVNLAEILPAPPNHVITVNFSWSEGDGDALLQKALEASKTKNVTISVHTDEAALNALSQALAGLAPLN